MGAFLQQETVVMTLFAPRKLICLGSSPLEKNGALGWKKDDYAIHAMQS